jgi:predicted nucleic acid-binding Zn ribbon protein
MHPVGELLPSLYRKLAREAVDEQALVLALWPVVAGKPMADRTRAVRLYGRTLLVETTDPEWRRQLADMTGLIVARLNAAAGKDVVQDIQFHLARRPPARAAAATGGSRDEADAIADPYLRRMYRLSRRREEK